MCRRVKRPAMKIVVSRSAQRRIRRTPKCSSPVLPAWPPARSRVPAGHKSLPHSGEVLVSARAVVHFRMHALPFHGAADAGDRHAQRFGDVVARLFRTYKGYAGEVARRAVTSVPTKVGTYQSNALAPSHARRLGRRRPWSTQRRHEGLTHPCQPRLAPTRTTR